MGRDAVDGCAVGDPGPLPSRQLLRLGAGATALAPAARAPAPGILRAMRLSHLFFTTLRDDPADAEMPSHRLLVRAGYVRQLGAGLYSLLPLGFRVTKRVEQVIREEMNAIGGQELEMPVVHPAEVWKDSGRYDKIGPELVRFKDRGDRDMVLAMTHEEVIALLLRDIVQSYRQLPVQLYHFQTKFRDEPRSRGGLIRVREFVMKDAYSCDLDDAGLDVSYRKQYGAYETIFKRFGLDAIAVGADVGIMGGSGAHEFMVLNDYGEDTLVLCDACGYAENQQIAEVAKPDAGCRGPPPDGGCRDPRRDDDRCPRSRPRDPTEPDRQGRVLRDRRRAIRGRHRPRRLRRQRDEAGQRDQGDGRAAPRPGRRDPGPRHGGGLRLAARCHATRSSSSTSSSRGRRTWSPARTGPDGTCATSTSRATTRRTSSPRSRTPARATPAFDADRRSSSERASRSGTSSSSGPTSRSPPGPRTSTRRASATRSSWARTASGSAGTSPASSRRTTTRRASRGRPRSRPIPRTSSRWARNREPKVTEVAEALYAAATAAGTEREILFDDRDESPGVKLTDAEMLGMPWILTVSPRSLTAGGVEVTERATGERAVRSIEDVTAFLEGRAATPV